MARILTGIQSTGVPHLGNILGAILPGIDLSQQSGNEAFFFIANLHTLTAVRDASFIRENTYAVAAAWLACGFDQKQGCFYRQSDLPEVCELTWYLSCFTPFPMLANAHSFKDKSSRRAEVNAGLFTYPILMAADILLYDAEKVPVGKDQVQHLEITRDIAGAFNNCYGETFVVPQAMVQEHVMVVPGIDGQKMSKSYGNTINLFVDDKSLRKNIMKIITGSEPLEAPKNPDTCTVFHLYKLVSSHEETESLRQLYLAGGFGFGKAKEMLFEKLLEVFGETRRKYAAYFEDITYLDTVLAEGAEKAKAIGSETLLRVRKKIGYSF